MQIMKNQFPLVATMALAILGSACGAQDGNTQDSSTREVYFDGAEVAAVLEQDSDVTFFVDIRDGAVNHFDQSETAIDFSGFLFQCPSMPSPVPMEDILENIDEQVYSSEYWSIQAIPPVEDEDGFRKAGTCPFEVGCDCVCQDPNSNPWDCFLVCSPP